MTIFVVKAFVNKYQVFTSSNIAPAGVVVCLMVVLTLERNDFLSVHIHFNSGRVNIGTSFLQYKTLQMSSIQWWKILNGKYVVRGGGVGYDRYIFTIHQPTKHLPCATFRQSLFVFLLLLF